MWWLRLGYRASRGVISGRSPKGPVIPGANRPQRIAERHSPEVQHLQRLFDAARNPKPANIVRQAARDVRDSRFVFERARARQEAERIYMPGQRGPDQGPWGPAGRDVTPRGTPRVSPQQRGDAPRAGHAQRVARAEARFRHAELRREREAAAHLLADEERRRVDEETMSYFLNRTAPAAAPATATGAAVSGGTATDTAVEERTPEGHSVRVREKLTNCKPRPRDNRKKLVSSGKRFVPWC